ncbi:hypothetical protein DNTS_027635 [Danionella cerebrum]|uniref:peptidylprolyl isomerase n=1 Tax=Danionella cerebrum TaxID=2873325 RepID=A0A553RAG2_9TELE|nr:hypothetical protein DNTS_027635 [Danionella translucida]
MVSIAPLGDMETEAEDLQEATLGSEVSTTMEEARSVLNPCQGLQEPIQELQMSNLDGEEAEEEAMDDKEDEEERLREVEMKSCKENEEAEEFDESLTDIQGSNNSPTDEPITSNAHNETKENTEERGKLTKTASFGKTVRFMEVETVEERDTSDNTLFPQFDIEEWTTSSFEELFIADHWKDITDDCLLRKKVLQPGLENTLTPAWGEEVTLKIQGVLEDRTVVEKDSKLVFVIGEGDVNQALEECAISMKQGEIALLLADSQYGYGLLGRASSLSQAFC